MFFIFFLMISLVRAHTRQYISTCMLSLDPYTASNNADYMIRASEKCLSRAYVSFPEEFKPQVKHILDTCIDKIRDSERSRAEYHALEKSISSVTSDLGSSIVESQHLLESLAFCATPLKSITSIDIYEESRFDSITKMFIHQLDKADHCIVHSIEHVEEATKIVEQKITEFRSKYDLWKNVTKQRTLDAAKCREDIDKITEDITAHILRLLHDVR